MTQDKGRARPAPPTTFLLADSARDDDHARVLTIVLPALNEEGSVAAVAQEAIVASAAISAVPGVGAVEVIVVDDGSTDRTAERASAVAGVRVLSLGSNHGYGGALKAGFEAAKGDLLAFCDADGTCRPAMFETLARTLVTRRCDVVIGSRLGAGTAMPAVRRLGNRMFAAMLGVLALRRVTDTASGMRVLTRSAYQRLSPLPDGLNFTPAMTAKVLLSGDMRIEECPMPYAEREGRSKLSVVRDGVRFLRTILETALLFQPFRMLGTAGGVFLALALVFLVRPLGEILRGGRLEEGDVYRMVSIAVFAVLGQTLLFAGALGEGLKEMFVGTPASANPVRRLIARALTPVAGLSLAAAAVAGVLVLNGRGLVRYVAHGDVGDMPWVNVLAGGYLLITAAQLFAGGVLEYMLRLIRLEGRTSLSAAREAVPVQGAVPLAHEPS